MKKQNAPDTTPLKKVLEGIREGVYYTSDAYQIAVKNGFEFMAVDISAIPFDFKLRYVEFTTTIPEKKRGNLSKFANKKVRVIVLGIARAAARVEFLIKET